MISNNRAPLVLTARRLKANRRNSRKSTGPRTAEGRAASRMNAVKHGILSSEVVVRGLRIQEHEEEFAALRERYWESLAPVGPAEEMLVDRIVTAQWRLRRALMAETGEIALSVDGGRWRRSNRDAIPLDLFLSELRDSSEELAKSSRGLDYLRHVLEEVREDVQREGELTAGACARFQKRFANQPNALTKELERFREKFVTNADGLSAEVLKDNHQRAVLNCIEFKLNSYAGLTRKREEREEKEESARQAADALPSPIVLEKIMRYETSLERQLYRAMNQLERLQRQRRGETVPPPLSVEISRR